MPHLTPEAAVALTFDTQVKEPLLTHPSVQSLGLFKLPSAAPDSQRRFSDFDADDASARELGAFAYTQYQELARLQDLLHCDLSSGLSTLDALDLGAMQERSRVALERVCDHNNLLNVQIDILSAQLRLVELWMDLVGSVDYTALLRAANSQGDSRHLGLSQDQFAKLRHLLDPNGCCKELETFSLSELYCSFARLYIETEEELTQISQTYFLQKQQASRLQFYTASLGLVAARSATLADGLQALDVNCGNDDESICQAKEFRAELARRLSLVAQAPVANLLASL